ncbi:MAG: leucine-rich repeat domain-containing protein [Tannerella sp.]|jgi:hypothetical protein|nr:leucine-rich repeat domain-containing protein [Tannerella sp.]
MKRPAFITFLLALPVMALAQTISPTEVPDTVVWYTEGHSLFIGGHGAVAYKNNPPWYGLRQHIRHVVVEDGISDIRDGTFAGMDSLQTLSLPLTLESIHGRRVFAGCNALDSLVLPEGFRILYVRLGGSGLRYMHIPNSVYYLGDNLFDGCARLSGVDLPNDISTIPRYCFRNCVRLESIVIPPQVEALSEGAFAGCIRLRRVQLPVCLQHIYEQAFKGCNSLRRLALPDSTDIAYGLDKCGGLQDIQTGKDNLRYKSIDGVLYDKAGRWLEKFPEGRGGSYTLPDTAGIGLLSFAYCYKLQNIFVRPTHPFYRSVGGVLYNRRRTRLLKFPPGRTRAVVPESVDSIFGYAFYFCDKLASLTLPAGLKEIGPNAFDGCKHIRVVIDKSPVPQDIDPLLFEAEVRVKAKLYVPRTALAAYKKAPGWGDFNHIIGF